MQDDQAYDNYERTRRWTDPLNEEIGRLRRINETNIAELNAELPRDASVSIIQAIRDLKTERDRLRALLPTERETISMLALADQYDIDVITENDVRLYVAKVEAYRRESCE